MILKRKKINFKKKSKGLSDEEYEEIKKQIEKEESANFDPAETSMDDIKKSAMENQPDDNNVVMQMIHEKRAKLSQEKKELSSLESKIKQDCSEIEALEYIASGEPTMSIMDLLNMLQDFCNDAEKYDDAISLLEDMEQTILKSTIQSIKG